MNNPVKLSLLDHTKPQEEAPSKDDFYNTHSTGFILPARKMRGLNCIPKNSRLPLL